MQCPTLNPGKRWFPKILALVVAPLLAASLSAQNAGPAHEIVYSFKGTDGSQPNGGLTVGPNGEFYGITSKGGSNDGGTAFKINPDGALTTLHSFDPHVITAPFAGLARGRDGNFYGVAKSRIRIFLFSTIIADIPLGGGIIFPGPTPHPDPLPDLPAKVYRIKPTGEFSVVQDLDFDPKGRLTAGSDGHLYGAAKYGGTHFEGSLFRVRTDGVVTTLHSFSGPDGSDPDPGTIYGTGTNPYGAGLIEGFGGEFFGLTRSSATRGLGTLFCFSTSTGLSTLHQFTAEEGLYPGGGLLRASDGTLYGTTNEGGPARLGTVFRFSGNTLTTLYAFTGKDGAGWYPESLTLAPDGHFYGTNSVGAPSGTFFGTIFKMTAAGELTTIHAFTAADGAKSNGGLVVGPDGNLYGMTSTGGAHGHGTIFRLHMGQGNRAPIAMDDESACRIPEDSDVLLAGCMIDVLANDFDPDSQDYIYPIHVSTPSHGRAAIATVNYFVAPPGRERNSGWIVMYKPDEGFVGTDQFTYTITDGRGGTATATVRVHVSSETPPAFTAGRYFGLVRNEDDRPSGMLRLAVTPTGSFSGQIRLGRHAAPVHGHFDAARSATLEVQFRHLGAATLQLQLPADSTTVTGRLTSADDAYHFTAKRIGRKLPPQTTNPRLTTPALSKITTRPPRRAGLARVTTQPNGTDIILLGRTIADQPFATTGVLIESGSGAASSILAVELGEIELR